jgi:NAD(P)-dependent dehydrogenase (short-subunit alcohol dehydrogenase family)
MRPVVVVLGASGGIGRAIAASQVAHGRHVVAVARGEQILAMRDEHVTPVVGDAPSPKTWSACSPSRRTPARWTRWCTASSPTPASP